jgi:hypothetical protein
MSSTPADPKSAAATARWRKLREAIDRGMLRTRGPLRTRQKQIENLARGVFP